MASRQIERQAADDRTDIAIFPHDPERKATLRWLT